MAEIGDKKKVHDVPLPMKVPSTPPQEEPKREPQKAPDREPEKVPV